MAGAGIDPSFGSVGDSCDNTLAETINGLYNAEVILRRGAWRSCEAVELATLEWVAWFNRRRLLEPIGNIPPAEAEANDYAATAAMDNLPMAAPLDPMRPALASRQQRRLERLQGYGLAPAAFSPSAVPMSAAPVPR